MPELTPIRDSRLRLVQRYGEGRFRISGERFEGSVVVFTDRVEKAPAETVADTSAASLLEILGEGEVDILLVGCGGAIPRLTPDFTAPPESRGHFPRTDGHGRRLPHLQRAGERRPPCRGAAHRGGVRNSRPCGPVFCDTNEHE